MHNEHTCVTVIITKNVGKSDFVITRGHTWWDEYTDIDIFVSGHTIMKSRIYRLKWKHGFPYFYDILLFLDIWPYKLSQ